MKILGKDGKEYKTIADAEIADNEYDAKVKAEKEERDRVLKAQEKSKKQLDTEIKLATKKIEEATINYNKVKKDTQKMLQDAYNSIREAEQKKFNLVSEFCDKYGPYSTTYTSGVDMFRLERLLEDFFRF